MDEVSDNLVQRGERPVGRRLILDTNVLIASHPRHQAINRGMRLEAIAVLLGHRSMDSATAPWR
jgi:hypothetical protein